MLQHRKGLELAPLPQSHAAIPAAGSEYLAIGPYAHCCYATTTWRFVGDWDREFRDTLAEKPSDEWQHTECAVCRAWEDVPAIWTKVKGEERLLVEATWRRYSTGDAHIKHLQRAVLPTGD
jgi:hypothetical protein